MAVRATNIQLRKFKVVDGIHAEGGKIYGKGDIVGSPYDLAAQLRGKFIEVDSDAKATRSARSAVAGENEPAAPLATPLPKAATSPEDPDKDDEGEAGAVAGPDGVDVSEKFPKALEQDYKVFKRDGLYWVYDEDDLTKPLAPGTKKAGVDEVVAEALKAK